MYEDRATVQRYEDVDKPNGSTKNEPVVIYQDQPCRISQRALGVNSQTDAENKIAYETKLFIAPDLDIRQGDMVEVKRGELSRKFTAGEPFLYPTHQEVSLQRKGYA
ncbi:ABC transporter ATP-binding protein [Paenibacillus larvae]|uniref:ABC transporter ATP-binding protein n=1 Tax=Paenibacillus larvae TaxID=1464 RepID=UPI002281806A|nr:ABC transporter ATP-binding protein [Paenibacillus larvae]MCY9512134.1 ABC transporter ATP-binding protein [Paenibacillus larvae]MCY9527670.1 ABC transporter ATP-binding protein [Paenibacillus larvae]